MKAGYFSSIIKIKYVKNTKAIKRIFVTIYVIIDKIR